MSSTSQDGEGLIKSGNVEGLRHERDDRVSVLGETARVTRGRQTESANRDIDDQNVNVVKRNDEENVNLQALEYWREARKKKKKKRIGARNPTHSTAGCNAEDHEPDPPLHRRLTDLPHK